LKGERERDVRICFDQLKLWTGFNTCYLPLLERGTEAICLLLQVQPGSTCCCREQHQPAFVNVPQSKVLLVLVTFLGAVSQMQIAARHELCTIPASSSSSSV